MHEVGRADTCRRRPPQASYRQGRGNSQDRPPFATRRRYSDCSLSSISPILTGLQGNPELRAAAEILRRDNRNDHLATTGLATVRIRRQLLPLAQARPARQPDPVGKGGQGTHHLKVVGIMMEGSTSARIAALSPAVTCLRSQSSHAAGDDHRPGGTGRGRTD